MALGIWLLELDSWNLALGAWFLELGSWSLALGAWFLELGSWNLALGAWFLELGSWSLELNFVHRGLDLGGNLFIIVFDYEDNHGRIRNPTGAGSNYS